MGPARTRPQSASRGTCPTENKPPLLAWVFFVCATRSLGPSLATAAGSRVGLRRAVAPLTAAPVARPRAARLSGGESCAAPLGGCAKALRALAQNPPVGGHARPNTSPLCWLALFPFRRRRSLARAQPRHCCLLS
eukprot:9495030-Pyramimonas_sp.AAC.1